MEKKVLFLAFLMLTSFLFPAVKPHHLFCQIVHWIEQKENDDTIYLNVGVVCSNNTENVKKGHDYFVNELATLMYENRDELGIYLTPSQLDQIKEFNDSMFFLEDAKLYLYYYKSTTDSKQPYKRVEIPGCYPLKANNKKEVSFIVPDESEGTIGDGNIKTKEEKITVYYGICPIGKNIYGVGGVKVYVDFSGMTTKNGVASGDSKSVFIYDDESAVLNEMASILAAHLSPSSPACFTTLLILGLLLASMYYSGLNPASLFDISIPYLPSPPGIKFSGKTLGVVGRRAGAKYKEQKEKAAKVILSWVRAVKNKTLRRVSSSNIRTQIENALDSKSVSPVKKAALLLCVMTTRGRLSESVIRWILNASDDRVLQEIKNAPFPPDVRRILKSGMIDRNGNVVSAPLLNALENYVHASLLSSFKGRAAGNLSKWPIVGRVLDRTIGLVTGCPLVIRPWNAWLLSARDVVFGLKVQGEMVKHTLSYPIRWWLQATGMYKGEGGLLQRWAALTDDRKIELGHWFRLDTNVSRTYKGIRTALYQDIATNILWLYARRRLLNALVQHFRTRFPEDVARRKAQLVFERMVRRAMNSRNVLENPTIISWFGRLGLDNDRFIQHMRTIISDPTIDWDRKARLLLGEAGKNFHHEDMQQVNRLLGILMEIRRIERQNPNDYQRLQALREYLENRWHIHGKDFNLGEAFIRGKVFITAGKEHFIFERQGTVASSSYFLVGSLKETINQWAYLGLMRRLEQEGLTHMGPFPSPEGFSFVDGFKLFYLKLKVMWLGWGDWYRKEMITVYDPEEGERRVSYAYLLFSKGGTRTVDQVNRVVDNIERRTRQYFEDLLSEEGRMALNSLDNRMSLEQLLYNPGLAQHWYLEETTPNPRYWRANMNFLWPIGGSASPPDRFSLLWQVLALKTKRFQPMDQPLEQMMEMWFRHRFMNMLAGSELFNLHITQDEANRYPVMSSFHLPDAYGSFLERVKWYEYIYDAYCQYFGLRRDDSDSYNRIAQLTERPFTYADFTNKKMPIIHLHDMSYVPYIKGMPVSDWDYIKNGIVTVRRNGRWEAVSIDRIFAEGERQLKRLRTENPELYRIIEELQSRANEVRGIPSEDAIRDAERRLRRSLSSSEWAKISVIFDRLRELYAEMRRCKNGQELDNRIEEVQMILTSFLGDGKNNGTLDRLLINDDVRNAVRGIMRPPRRTLMEDEFEEIRRLLHNDAIPIEIRVILLNQFSQATKEWYRLWREADFIRIDPLRRAPEGSGWFTRAGIRMQEVIGKGIEKWIYGVSRSITTPLAEEVALSELYRSRTHELYMRVRTPQSELNTSNYVSVDYDLSEYNQAWKEWADSWPRFMGAWACYITRDPRGSSTQYGKEWYMAGMYHRGPSMPPPLHVLESMNYYGDNSLFTKMKMLSYRMLTPAWYLNSWLIRGVRNVQTGMYGWPTLYDINVGPDMNLDLMKTYVDVKRPLPHIVRSLFHPGEIMGGVGRWFRFRDAQETERGGVPIMHGVWEAPEHFTQMTGGFWFRRHTDAANPGLSRVDAFGQSRLDPRIAVYLIRESEYRHLFASDYYVRRLAEFSGVHRGISAEAKLFTFQRDMEGYGPKVNYLWSFISPAFFGYYLYHRVRSSIRRGEVPFVGGAVNRMQEMIGRSSGETSQRIRRWAMDKYMGFKANIRICPICGARFRRDGICPNCGYSIRYW